MEMPAFDSKQQAQEDQYSFPYHYLDLVDEWRMHIDDMPAQLRREHIRDLLSPIDGKRILDAGCGDGRFCYELRSTKADILGVDLSEAAIAFARAFNPAAKFSSKGLQHLASDTKFDAIILIETLEHIPLAEVQTVLSRLAEALAPGAPLILTVPSSNVAVASKHYQHFSQESLHQCLKPHFGEISITGMNVLKPLQPKSLKWRRRLARRVFGLRRFDWARTVLEDYRTAYRSGGLLGRPEDCKGLLAIARSGPGA